MTGERVRAAQAARAPKGARLVRGTVVTASPLSVQIAGGGTVAGIAVPGATYTPGDVVLVIWQEPGVGPVFPASSTPSSSAGPAGVTSTTATGLAAGAAPTATVSDGVLALGIPAGATGPAGTYAAKGAGVYPTGNTPYSSPGSDMIVGLNSGIFNDDGAYYSLDGTGITVLQAGLYIVTWAVDWAGGFSAGSRNSFIALNGGDWAEANAFDTGGHEQRVNASSILRMGANTAVRLHVSSDTACSVQSGGVTQNTNLKIARLGS